MTVCLAAICEDNEKQGMLIVAADRMLTADDIEFEPQRSKIIELSKYIVVLIAGDVSIHAEILMSLRPEIKANPKINIKDIAEKYQIYYNAWRRARLASAVLAPLGLDHESFISRQQEMAPDFLVPLTNKLFYYDFPRIQAIIAGLDDNGPQLYVVDASGITCQNMVGFAAIGKGEQHAKSQFMLSNHKGKNPWEETLWLLYKAKKSAEVAPEVGKHTDIRIIGEGFLHTELPQGEIRRLQKIYEASKSKEDLADQEAAEKVREMIEEG